MKMLIAVLFGVVLGWVPYVLAAPPSYAPWELVSPGYNGGIKTLHHNASSSVDGANGAGVLYLGGDDGGVYRSRDCGATWDVVNGGPAVTEGKLGGYDPGCLGNPGCSHRMLYGGPPGITRAATTAFSLASGPWPQDLMTQMGPPGAPASAIPGSRLSLRSGRVPYFSNDDGQQWYPVAPSCQGISTTFWSSVSVVASDPGDGKHLLFAATDGEYGGFQAPWSAKGSQIPKEVSNCGEPGFCARRTVAWTGDASAQLTASFAASRQRANNAPRQIDLASNWHFASLAHLAAGDGTATGCAGASLPAAGKCKAKTLQTFCRGNQDQGGDSAPEDFCLQDAGDIQDPCYCNTGPATCRYPTVHDIAVDPRNGWAYAATQVGLLVSPDGGRTWGRTGNKVTDKNGSSYAPNAQIPPAANDALYAKAKVMLLTAIPIYGAPEMPNYDLNQFPHKILDVGKISMVSRPATCPFGAMPDNAMPG